MVLVSSSSLRTSWLWSLVVFVVTLASHVLPVVEAASAAAAADVDALTRQGDGVARQVFPLDQVFVIDVQELLSFDDFDDDDDEDEDRGLSTEMFEQIVLREFLRIFGSEVDLFDRNESIPAVECTSDTGAAGNTGGGVEYVEITQEQAEQRQLTHTDSCITTVCPLDCRPKPWETTCKVLKCARRRRRSSTSSVTAVAATETLSFDLAKAKQAMYTALQEYAKSLKLTTGIVTPDLATDQDYTTAAVFVVKDKRQQQHAQVKCVPHSINGELCAFQTQFQYPDAMYVSFWFVSRNNNNKNNKNGDNYPINWKEYFETQQRNKDDYFRTILVVEKGGTRTKNNTCRALMERTKDYPLTFKKCSICNNNNNNLETTTEGQQQEPPLMVSIDSTNIGARLGIEVFGKLWRGHKTTCESTDPVFFPLKTFHSWL